MINKKVMHSTEARDALKRGVDILANSVKVTLGPKGRNVVIDSEYGTPSITKDGVTVAKHINLEDRVENMGAQMIKEVASKTAEVAGDATTTSVVLAQAIITAGLKNVTAGANPMDLKRGIDKAVTIVVEALKKQSIPVNDNFKSIRDVGTVSANGDEEIGSLIAEAMEKVGTDGVIYVEESKTAVTEIKVLDGMMFANGYLDPGFINNPKKMIAEYEDCSILMYDRKITFMNDVFPILQKHVESQRPLLIIAEDVDGEALASMVVNTIKGNLPIVAVQTPGYGMDRKDLLEDIAILTGATFISDSNAIRLVDAEVEHLGTAGKITVDRDSTTIIGGGGDPAKIKERIEQLRGQIESTETEYEKSPLKRRLAKLAGGVAILSVGASTQVEMQEKKDRIDDALHATKAAVEEGIVSGGGVALIRAIKSLDGLTSDNGDEITGIQIIRRAIEEPLRQICANAGVNSESIVEKVSSGKLGYNARTGVFEDLIKAGVIDPTKVTRVALENAASIASLLLTTECVLINVPPTS